MSNFEIQIFKCKAHAFNFFLNIIMIDLVFMQDIYRLFSRDVTERFHKWQRRTGWQENRLSYSNSVKLAYFTLLPFKNRWHQGAESDTRE